MLQHILTIAKKEFVDTLRDRRTMLTMIVIPLLLFPILMYALTAFQMSVSKKAQEKELKIGLIAENQNEPIIEQISNVENTVLIKDIALADTTSLIDSDSLDLVVWVSPDFGEKIDSFESGMIKVFFKSTDDNKIKNRLLSPIKAFEKDLLRQRLVDLSMSSETIDPIDLVERDVASQQERFGQLVGGFLPYIFIIFCFIGCMYPAIDLFTGEKERGTLETILTLPVHRIRFLIGKMIVVAISGFTSALLALTGLFFSVKLIPAIPDELLTLASNLLQAESIILMLGLLLPLTIFFAGILIPIASYAKTFKEAQSLITPLNFIVIIPAALGLTPGIELELKTALIPVLNVALSTKEIVSGTADYGLLAVVFSSLLLLATISVVFSVKWFDKETNIMRT